MDTRFSQEMRRILGSVPERRVAECGDVARALGDVRAARAVAEWVRDHPRTPGARRIVRADGTPVVGGRGGRGRFGEPSRRVDPASLPRTGILTRLRSEQRRLAREVVEEDPPGPMRIVGGVDASYEGSVAFAAAVLVDATDGRVLEVSTVRVRIDFPYIPTYLGYRELPAFRAAVLGLEGRADALLVDGHGRLHPAGMGVACLVGLRLGVPTVGVAKHPLVGRARPGRAGPHDAIPIELDGRIRGHAWTPPRASRPLFVSVGHRFTLATALRVVRQLSPERGPVPLLLADREARKRRMREKRERGS